MTNRLLMTTAALALTAGLAGAGIAQDRGGASGREGASPAPPAQQSAPAEKTAPSGAMERGATERRGGDAVRSQSNGAQAPATTGQSPSSATDRKVEGEPRNQNRMRGAGENNNDATRSPDRNAQQPASGQNQRSDQRNGSPSPSRAGTPGQQDRAGTTGQGAAGARGAVNLSTEQRSTIKTVIHEQKVQPTSLNVSISVGTRIPHGTRLHPLPARVVEVYPAWRGYEYILVGDQIVVIDPATLEIVAVLEA